MGSDLYFYEQVETRKVPKRYRKLPEELPESLRFAHLNPKVAALLAKERSQRPDNEDPFGDGMGKKSLLPDINAAFTNVRNQFDSNLSNDEDSQRYLFEEAKMSAATILQQLSRIIYFYEDLHSHIPKSLEYQLMSGWGDLTNDVTIVPREWQTHEMKEQYTAKQQQEVNSDEELSDNDMLTGRSKSRMGTSERSVSDQGSKLNVKKSKPKLDGVDEGDLQKPDSRLGRRSESRASATGSVFKGHLDIGNLSRVGSRRKGSSLSSHRSITGMSPSFFKNRTKDDLFSMIAETPVDARSTALNNPLSYMQTINFQLSNKTFEDKGWIMLKGRQEEIDQNEILEYCVTRLQESMKQIATQRQKDSEQGFDKPVVVRYYGDTKKETLLKYRKSPVKSNPCPIYKGGKPRIPSIIDERNEGKKLMQASHQDGSCIIYYPSGRPAVIHSAAGFGRPGFYTIVYEDGLDSKMLACFTPNGRGVCYFDNGVVRFLATDKGGHILEIDGKQNRKWKWPHTSVKITEPVSFQISNHVMFRCVSQGQMTLVFSCQKEMARFCVGPVAEADEYKFIDESDQLLSTFTFSSKAAKDLMRIFAPTKKSKRKNRKEEKEENKECEERETDSIRPAFNINLVRRVRRMSLMPTKTTPLASLNSRAAVSLTQIAKDFKKLHDGIKEQDENTQDEIDTPAAKSKINIKTVDTKVSKLKHSTTGFTKDIAKDSNKGISSDSKKETPKTSIKDMLKDAKTVQQKKKIIHEAVKQKNETIQEESTLSTHISEQATVMTVVKPQPKEDKGEAQTFAPESSKSFEAARKYLTEDTDKRAKSAKLHVEKSREDLKTGRMKNKNLSPSKSVQNDSKSSPNVFERLSVPRPKHFHCTRHHSETKVVSPKRSSHVSSEYRLHRDSRDFERFSGKISDNATFPIELKSIMKKPGVASHTDTRNIGKCHSARLNAKSDIKDESVKRAHSANLWCTGSSEEIDKSKMAIKVNHPNPVIIIENDDGSTTKVFDTPEIKINSENKDTTISHGIPIIVIEDDGTDSAVAPLSKDDATGPVSSRSVIGSVSDVRPSSSFRVSFREDIHSTGEKKSSSAIGQVSTSQIQSNLKRDSSEINPSDAEGNDTSSPKGSHQSVDSSSNPSVKTDSGELTKFNNTGRKVRRSSIMKSIKMYHRQVLAKKGVVLSEEEDSSSDEHGSDSDDSQTSKSNASDIIKLTENFPDRVSYDIEADKELAKLQRKAKNLVEDWLEHYRMAVGFASPYLQMVQDTPNYSIANRHAKSARLSDHQQMIRKAILRIDDDQSPRRARISSAPLDINEDDDDDDAKTAITDRIGTTVTFEDNDEDGYMSPTAMAVINRLSANAGRRSARSKVSSARSGSPSRQQTAMDRAPSASSGSRSHCPLVIRQYKLGYERPQCRCSRHHIPFIMDLEIDEFIATESPEGQLTVIMVVSSLFPGITKAEEMVNEIYTNQNRNRTRPCVQSRSDMFRVFKYDINSAAEMSDHTQPLLLTRHNVVPGMFLIYCDGKLLFCDHIFNGYGNTRKDFKKQIMKSRHDSIHGQCLPKDFKFSPSRGKSGMRSGWGGEIGGAGVDKYSSPGTVIDSSLQPIHRPESSSTNSGINREIHVDAVKSTSRRPFLPHIDTSQTGTSSDHYQYESVRDWVSASLQGLQHAGLSKSTSFATGLSEYTY